MPADGFDAGSIFVQVVPSFRDVQRIIEKDSERWGDALEKRLSEGMERGAKQGAKKANETFTEELGKGSEKQGQEAAEKYAGSFRTTLQKAIASMEREIKPIELNTASTKTLAELEKVKASLKELSETKVEPGMDVRGILREAAKIEAAIKGLSQDVDLDVKWDSAAALADWRSMVKRMEAMAKIEPKANFAPLERQLGAFEQKFKDSVGRAAKSIGDQSTPELLKLRKRIEDLGDAEIGIDVSATDALAELQAIHLEVAQLNGTTADVHVRVDSNAALKALTNVVREVDDVDRKTKPFERGGGLIARLLGGKGAGGQGQEVANAFRTFNGVLLAAVTLGPALIPILAGIAGGLTAIGPAALAGASGVGVLLLAFSGIGDAVGALMDQEKSAAKDALSSVRTMRNAAQGVEDAQRSLTRARRDAKQAGLDAAKAVADAEEEAAKRNEDAARRVADAREQSSRSIDAAIQRQRDAEERLADTQRDAKRAQEDLTKARVQAQKDLDDIADRSKQNALDIRQATLDLFDATTANNATQADPGATNYEKEQADVNLKQAQLRLEELRETQKDLADQKRDADKGGVNGTDRVVEAQERLNDALEAQKDAQDDVRQSAVDLRQAQRDGIQAVNDAIRAQAEAVETGRESVAAALENQRRTAISNAESVADSQRGLQRAQQSYNDALYDTGVIGSSSAQKVRDAFANLGPEARDFALFIFGLRGEFYKLRAVAAAGILPGVQDLLSTIVTKYGPDILKFVGDMSSVLGQLAKDFGTTLGSDVMQEFFGVFAEAAPLLTAEFGKGALEWMKVFARLMILATPVAGKFLGFLTDLGEKTNAFFDSPKGMKTMRDFFAYVARISPKVEDFFGALLLAVINIARAIAPVGEDILDVVTNVLKFIAGLDPEILKVIVVGILGLVAAFQLAAAATFLVGAAATFIASPLQIVIVIIGAVVLALYLLYTRSETARKIIDAAFAAIGAVVSWLWNNITKPYLEAMGALFVWLGHGIADVWTKYIWPALKVFGSVLQWLWVKVFKPVIDAILVYWNVLASALGWVWNSIIWPIFKVFGKIVWELFQLGFKLAIAAIVLAWKGLSEALKFVWDKVLKPLFDLFMKVIGDDLVKAFQSAVGFIKKHWDTIKQIALTPIQFVIDVVLNKGLIFGFNKLAEVFHMDKVDDIPVPKFARGGVYPGYTPGRDIGFIGVSGGEAIMRPEWTRAMQALDPNYINEANKRARLGGVGGVMKFLGGFREGGEVNNRISPFARTTFRGKSLDYYTIRMLLAAEKLAGHAFSITQGSYSTSVAASGSTHAGGGAMDLGWTGKIADVIALRLAGFAAWWRNPSQGPWNHHIHAIAAGDPTASPAALRQVESYYNGGDGLGGRDTQPNVGKDPGLLDNIIGGLGDLVGWVRDAVGNPAKWLKDQIGGKLGDITKKFGDSALTKLLTKIPETLIEGMVDKIKGFDLFGSGGGNSDLKSMAQEMLNNAGWGQYWGDFDWLVNKESGWKPDAQNPVSSAYGLMQMVDGTWEGGRKSTDPREQLRQGINYIRSRYGNPAAARAFHEKHGWYKDGGVVPDDASQLFSSPTGLYDTGGVIPEGLSQVLNLTGGDEHAAVFTTDQWERLNTGAGGDINITLPMMPTNASPADVADEVLFAARRIKRGGAYLGVNGSD